MVKQYGKYVLNVVLILLYVYIVSLVSGIITKQAQTMMDYRLPLIWSNFWPLPLAAYFAGNRLRTLVRPGKLRVEAGYFILPVLYLLCWLYLPLLSSLLLVFKSCAILALIAWYNLLYAFYKEAPPAETPEPPAAA